jgi:hypothetical protein
MWNEVKVVERSVMVRDVTTWMKSIHCHHQKGKEKKKKEIEVEQKKVGLQQQQKKER